MHDIVTMTALAMLALAAALAFGRMLRGPTVPDQVVALDLVGVLIVCMMVTIAAATGEQTYLDVAIVIALVSFVGTVAYARFIEREDVR
jgi:multicomponent Na+:H+ antiporter subunit F